MLVTPEVSQDSRRKLKALSDAVTEVEAIPNPHSPHVQGWVDSGFTKLRIWTLTMYEKVVYLDADCLVMAPLDEVRQGLTRARAACWDREGGQLTLASTCLPALWPGLHVRRGTGRLPPRPFQRRLVVVMNTHDPSPASGPWDFKALRPEDTIG